MLITVVTLFVYISLGSYRSYTCSLSSVLVDGIITTQPIVELCSPFILYRWGEKCLVSISHSNVILLTMQPPTNHTLMPTFSPLLIGHQHTRMIGVRLRTVSSQSQ